MSKIIIKNIFIFLFLLFIILPFVKTEELNREFICSKVYEGILGDKTNQEIIDRILNETDTNVPNEVINYYKNNWDDICKNELKLVLDSESLCKKLYYFILERNWDFKAYQIEKELNLSYDIIANYIDNNQELCVFKGHSLKLPERNLKEILIFEREECTTDLKSMFNLYIPIFKIPAKGECEDFQILKWFFKFEDKGYSYVVNGIRIFPIFVLGILIFLGYVLYGVLWLNKKIGEKR